MEEVQCQRHVYPCELAQVALTVQACFDWQPQNVMCGA